MLPRKVKRGVLRLLNPLDAVVRRINGKQHLPPLHLRWEVGPLRGFEQSAAEYRMFLQVFGGLRPSTKFLDIGCGCGQLALELRDILDSSGRYEGWDIYPEAIQWCTKVIQSQDSRFTFQTLDVRNGMYNPKGSTDAAALRFPETSKADIVLLKSVFTHMLYKEMRNYLLQIPALLSPGGRCTASYFLLNERQKDLQRQGRNTIAFQPMGDGVAVVNPMVPEAIVAFEESVVMKILNEAGLRLSHPVFRGGWTGDRSALSHQDILVLEHE